MTTPGQDRGFSGRIVVLGLILIAAVAGVGLYYSLQYAARVGIEASTPEARVFLTSLVTDKPEEVPTEDFQGIASNATPLGYKACFKLTTSIATLTESFKPYEHPTPLTAPRHFTCFDARAIDEALTSGTAVAFLGQENVLYGIDRVVAVMEDGQAYSWNQINRCGRAVLNRSAVPQGCPPPPENTDAQPAD